MELWWRGVRNLVEGQIRLGAGLNLVVGPNGSGKTSLLEACHILGLGRSFRAHRLARVVQTGRTDLAIAGKVVDSHDGRARVAVEWTGQRRSRLNGEWIDGHWEVARRLPVVAVHADSFALLSGAPEERRRLLDWGAFYSDAAFPEQWQQWRRAHEQRNAALRRGDETGARHFEVVAAAAGARLTVMRARFVDRLAEQLGGAATATLRRGLEGDLEICFRQGWPEGEPLMEAYSRGRNSDLERGFGQMGPQKADLDLRVAGRLVREASRGEQKRVLNALMVAQGLVLVGDGSGGQGPLVLLDDAVAEMDAPGLGGIMSAVQDRGWQCVATTVDQGWARSMASGQGNATMFHVKHGVVDTAT